MLEEEINSEDISVWGLQSHLLKKKYVCTSSSSNQGHFGKKVGNMGFISVQVQYKNGLTAAIKMLKNTIIAVLR